MAYSLSQDFIVLALRLSTAVIVMPLKTSDMFDLSVRPDYQLPVSSSFFFFLLFEYVSVHL